MKPEETVRKVGFLGTSPSSRHLAPFDDDEWEIWGMGPAYEDEGLPTKEGFPCMRWHRWFEIHPMSDNDPSLGTVVNPGYWEWLEKQTKPIYFRPPLCEELPGEEFPWDEILERHGGYFLDSTPAWMMAFAYDYFPNLTDIGLYGIDFASEPERREQKKGTYHFIRLFKLKGVKVDIPHESDMAYEPPPYPEADPFKKKIEASRDHLNGLKARLEREREKHRQGMVNREGDLLRIEGALEQLEYFEGNRT